MKSSGHGAALSRLFAGICLLAALVAPAPVAAASDPESPASRLVVDSGDDPHAWTAIASHGATAVLGGGEGRSGRAVAMRFDLGRGRTHAILKRAVSLELPAAWRLVFRLRGSGQRNIVEIKLISGENVWWWRRPEYELPGDWKDVPVSDSRVAFAWGPAGGGMPRHLDSIEIAVTAGSGGDGTLWIDEIRLESLDGDASKRPPAAAASSNPADAARLLDGDPATVWRSAADDPSPVVTLDFHEATEQGGFVVEHAPDGFASAYVVETSTDALHWQEVRRFTQSDGGLDDVYMPDAYARHARLRFSPPPGRRVAIGEIRVQPFAFSESENAFFTTIARRSARGLYPRYFAGEQSYWTIAGVSGGNEEALVNEEGSVEIGAGGWTLEPFVFTGGRLHTWHDGSTSVSLENGDLPIPTVTRRDKGFTLAVTAFAAGPADAATLYVRYRVTRHGPGAMKLFVAMRPFQVLPPWQSLNRTGGVASVRGITRRNGAVHADGQAVVAWPQPDAFGAAAFEQGDITQFLLGGSVPPHASVADAFEHASAAFAWDLPGADGSADVRADGPADGPGDHPGDHPGDGTTSHDVWIAVPWSKNSAVSATPLATLQQTAARWQARLDTVGIELPASVRDWSDSLRSNLAYILLNRDGAAIQPGSRNYERSWIRDGAMTSAALLELGFDDEVKEFLRWYAGFVGKDGWVPCCVDARGADPVPEHDSFGEFIWAIAEVWRFTRDEAFVREMYVHASAAADCMSRLRALRTTPEYEAGDKRAFHGLLPESISHEGYSARPVHSYWDQAFALRGFADAALLAGITGDAEGRERFSRERDALEAALADSIRRTMAAHGLEVVPASVELADFDPTSTAVSFLLGTDGVYPVAALERSFDRYISDLRKRSGLSTRGTGYTAYELRSATALVLLGRKAEAIELLGTLVADQRPPEWNQWPEISWLDRTEPSFLGDLPHTWIGSSFVHAVRTLLVTERREPGAGVDRGREFLIVGAGVPLAWLDHGDVLGRALATWFGAISVKIARSETLHDAAVVELSPAVAAGISGRLHPPREFTIPDGGIVVHAPFGRQVAIATIDGVESSLENDSVRVTRLPATVVFQYKPRLENPS